ncbi:MAG: T9SS type A sorting domain-containing protein [Chitinophagaceae bacterium]
MRTLYTPGAYFGKRNIISLCMLLLPFILSAQEMRIGQGTSVVIQGDAKLVLNDAGLVNNGSFSAGNSTVLFTGNAGKQLTTISGGSRTAFYNLSINKPFSQVQLGNDISVSGLLSMGEGNLELNNRRLALGSSGSIAGERADSRITGAKGGVVIATAVLNAPQLVNPGNLGVQLSSSANLGYTVITRGHVQQANGQARSIERYYEIQPAFNTADISLKIFYLEPELGGNNEAELVLWNHDAGRGWVVAGKENSELSANWIAKNNVNGVSRFTLGVADRSAFATSSVKGISSAGIASLQAFPNPASDRFTISLYSGAEKKGTVALQDQNGHVLERKQLQYVKGLNTMQWNIAKYAAGTYYVVFEGMGVANLKVVKQ